MHSRVMATVCLSALGLSAASGLAQDAPPADEPKKAIEEKARQELTATAVLVRGKVWQAPVGTPAADTQAWKPVVQGDELSSGTQVRVSIRSTLLLQYGDDTVIQLKSITLASLDELYKTETAKVSRIGLAYGTIRGSVREKRLRSDMVIESPTVTCSKEGTENFQMRVMRGYRAWWADGPTEGAVLVRDVGTGRSERLSFGQLVNYLTMTTPAVQRNLLQQVVDLYGNRFMSTGERDFNLFVDTGPSVTGPGLGAQATGVIPGTGRPPRDVFPRFENVRDETLGLILRQHAALLFRQVESRFGTGRPPVGLQSASHRK